MLNQLISFIIGAWLLASLWAGATIIQQDKKIAALESQSVSIPKAPYAIEKLTK